MSFEECSNGEDFPFEMMPNGFRNIISIDDEVNGPIPEQKEQTWQFPDNLTAMNAFDYHSCAESGKNNTASR